MGIGANIVLSQNEGRNRPETQMYACYGFSIAWWAHWLTNVQLSADMLDNGLYMLFQKRKWMTETWFIKDPVAIFNWFGVNVKTVNKQPAEFQPRKRDIIIAQWKAPGGISHFTPADYKGRSLYDSWFSPEGGSRAVREGQIISWRIFR